MNFSFQKGWTALTIASSKGHVECVKLLLDAEVDHMDGVSAESHSFIVQKRYIGSCLWAQQHIGVANCAVDAYTVTTCINAYCFRG